MYIDSESERGGKWVIGAAARVTALVLMAVNGVVVEMQKDV